MKAYRTGNKSSHGARCYASGGRVPEDISDPGSLPKVMGGPGKADGGMIDGGKAKRRLDRPSKSPVSVNVIVTGKDKSEPSAITPPLGAIPTPPPMPPPAAPPMGGPPGAMPPMPMRKHGGRVKAAGQDSKTEKEAEAVSTRKMGGKVMQSDVAEDKKLIKSMVDKDALKKRASGGRVPMDAGAGSGEGRLEKVKDYGKAAGKPAKGE